MAIAGDLPKPSIPCERLGTKGLFFNTSSWVVLILKCSLSLTSTRYDNAVSD